MKQRTGALATCESLPERSGWGRASGPLTGSLPDSPPAPAVLRRQHSCQLRPARAGVLPYFLRSPTFRARWPASPGAPLSPFFRAGRPPPPAGGSPSAALTGCRAQVQGGVLSPLRYAIQPALHPCQYAPSKNGKDDHHDDPWPRLKTNAIKLISPAEVSAGTKIAYRYSKPGRGGAVKDALRRLRRWLRHP